MGQGVRRKENVAFWRFLESSIFDDYCTGEYECQDCSHIVQPNVVKNPTFQLWRLINNYAPRSGNSEHDEDQRVGLNNKVLSVFVSTYARNIVEHSLFLSLGFRLLDLLSNFIWYLVWIGLGLVLNSCRWWTVNVLLSSNI